MDARGPKTPGGDALGEAVSGVPSLPSSASLRTGTASGTEGGSWVGVAGGDWGRLPPTLPCKPLGPAPLPAPYSPEEPARPRRPARVGPPG